MNKTLVVSILAGATAIFLGNVAFTAYQARNTTV